MNPDILGVIGPRFLNQVPTLGFWGVGFITPAGSTICFFEVLS